MYFVCQEVISDQIATPNLGTERGKKRPAASPGTENIHKETEEKKTDDVGPTPPPKPRRGRPPKSESQGSAAKNEDSSNKPSGRGRKRAAASQESAAGVEAGNAKVPKQQDGTAKKTAQRQMDLQR